MGFFTGWLSRGLSCAAALAWAAAAPAMEVSLGGNGIIRFGDGDDDVRELSPVVFAAGWRGLSHKGFDDSTNGVVGVRYEIDGRRAISVEVSLRRLDAGRAEIGYAFRFDTDASLECIGCSLRLPAATHLGAEWRLGHSRGVFARPGDGGVVIAGGKGREFDFPLVAGDGPRLRLSADGDIGWLVQDNWRWAPDFGIRLGELSRREYKAGDVVAFRLVASYDEPLVTGVGPFVIRPGNRWWPLEYRRDIVAGSALDFSGMGFVDAPAGKHGWLRNVGGHFEFERLPGKPQRFYGVNTCGTANFPDHELADALAQRFRMLGYNALRLHHHDAGTVAGSSDGVTLNESQMERMDYFVAAAIREGLYITTDLFVSRTRAPIKWRHIGVDEDGSVDAQLFKALCAVHEPAFENWAAYARNFLTHVNRYTGRRYIDEPALPLISLVNEGGFFMGWSRGVPTDPRILESWKAWLAAKRAADPSFAPDLSGDALPGSFWAGGIHPAIAQWTGELEAKMVARMKAFLRSLGCKALLTNDNCGPHYAPLQAATAHYDYIDDHFYVDHPSFPVKPWRLPSTCPNTNPLLGKGSVAPDKQAFSRMLGKPFTITEWNFSGPGRYRGVGGILAGAMAALQDWDGMWRFAYSHSRDGLRDADVRSPGYFDLASDPLSQAGERASICLFLRGDIEPLDDGVALWVTPESIASDVRTWNAAPSWSEAAWSMRTGSCLSPDDAKGLAAVRRESAETRRDEILSRRRGRSPLTIDRERGSFTIDTPGTCGGFVPSGALKAGSLRAKVVDAPATVWVSALDGKAIPQSRRLLLTHLTDVQGDGVTFCDRSMTMTLKWGGRPLVRNGTVHVALGLDRPERYSVYGLATNGRRVAAVPSWVKDGWLRFTATVAGPDGARMLYEVVAE